MSKKSLVKPFVYDLNVLNNDIQNASIIVDNQICKNRCMTFIKPKKLPKIKKHIVNRSLELSSSPWCTKSSNLSDDKFESKEQEPSPIEKYLSSKTLSTKDLQSSKTLIDSVSSMDFTNSEDFLNNNPFIQKLKNISIVQKNKSPFPMKDSEASLRAKFDSFFPSKMTYMSSLPSMDGSEYQDECERNASAPVYRQFVHRFHWSENIEHSSPWVRHRTREIFNHVSKLLETQKRDTSEIGGQKTFGNSAANAVRGNGVVGETDDDDSAMVTCELASKLCDAIVKHDETGGKVLSPQRQCSRNDGRFKWTELYTKLVNRGQL